MRNIVGHPWRLVSLLAATIWVGLGPGVSATQRSSHSHSRHHAPAPVAALSDSEARLEPVFSGLASPEDTSLAALGRQIHHIAASAGGAVGVSVQHVESGQRLSLRGNERFPMASVFKIPIALQLLHLEACEKISLDDTVPITSNDLRTGSGWIRHHRSRTAKLSVRELLEAMLEDSDNTASDRLLRLCGGPAAVNQRLRDLGIEDIRVDRSEATMSLDYSGVADAPPESTWTIAEMARLKQEVPETRQQESAKDFLTDPRDTATPDAMVDLLLMVLHGQALGPDETSRLIEIMELTRTGPGRLRGKLPPGTTVAHKTGTWSTTFGITAAVNDVGIITLPGDAGHLAIAVFVKGSNRGSRRIERAIASIARVSYDHWTLAAPALAGTAASTTNAGAGAGTTR